jgi:hypothetical protein
VFAQILNPPTLQNVTARYGQLQNLGSGGLTTSTPPALTVYEYNAKLPSSVQWNGGAQMALPWAMTLDVSYVGQHQYNIVQGVNLNAVDYGAAFLAKNQDTTVVPSTTPGQSALSQDLMRSIRGYSSITQNLGYQWRTYHSVQWSLQRRFRNGVSFGFNDTMGLSDHAAIAPRYQHAADGTISIRSDQAQAQELLGNQNPLAHVIKGNFVWDLPDLKSTETVMRVVGLVINDWQLSGVWTAQTGSTYTVGQSYQSGGGSINLTGSPDFGARIRVVGDPGSGCATDVYRQFNTAAFQGPLTNSVGLESGNGYLKGCFQSAFDLSIARNIRFGGSRSIQLRVDMFNAPNQAIVTGRNTSLSLTSPNDPITAQNLAYDPTTGLLNNGVNLLSTGAISPNRSQPKNAGFGVANGYQGPRSIQAQVRFSF